MSVRKEYKKGKAGCKQNPTNLLSSDFLTQPNSKFDRNVPYQWKGIKISAPNKIK